MQETDQSQSAKETKKAIGRLVRITDGHGRRRRGSVIMASQTNGGYKLLPGLDPERHVDKPIIPVEKIQDEKVLEEARRRLSALREGHSSSRSNGHRNGKKHFPHDHWRPGL